MLTLQYVRETPADEAFPYLGRGLCVMVPGFGKAWCSVASEHNVRVDYPEMIFPQYLPRLFQGADGSELTLVDQQAIRVQVLRTLSQWPRITPERLAAALVQVAGILAHKYEPGWSAEVWRTIHRIAQREAHNV